MAKLNHCIAVIFFLTVLCKAGLAQAYPVHYRAVDADSATIQKVELQTKFITRIDANAYLAQLTSLLRSKGFVTASVDSLRLDSSQGRVVLFLGDQYKWTSIHTLSQDQELLDAIRWPASSLAGTMDFNTLHNWQQRILDYLEDNGHPFGKTYLDNISIHSNEVEATLHIDQGPIYKIDSIRVYGDAKVDNEFLQKYLEIPNGSIYNRKKLLDVGKKLSELSYVQVERQANISYLGTGSVLNLYLKAKRNSQINALVGFLPNSDPLSHSQFLLTVDANILLHNALSMGETIGLMWQQLQKGSPRLNIIYQQPYIFHSQFGLSFAFDMYKQDSIYLNINMNLGATYRVTTNQSATIFLLRRQTIVSTIDTFAVIRTKQLPLEGDVSSINLGLSYDYSGTDYRFNPRRGNELSVTGSAGTKNIKKNSTILKLKDPSNPSYNFEHLYDTVKQNVYQFRITATAAHYLPLGKQSTVKLAVNGGLFSSANYFRNELFQIGGYKLLRGFNEESQYVSQYAIGTVEYRYLLGLNSAFFVFADGGYGKHLLEAKQDHTYIGTGIGLSFETKAGIINLAWAVGKRDDTDLNLRESKIHIGFASYF